MKTLILKNNIIILDNIAYTQKEDRDNLAIYFAGRELPLVVKNGDRNTVLEALGEKVNKDNDVDKDLESRSDETMQKMSG